MNWFKNIEPVQIILYWFKTNCTSSNNIVLVQKYWTSSNNIVLVQKYWTSSNNIVLVQKQIVPKLKSNYNTYTCTPRLPKGQVALEDKKCLMQNQVRPVCSPKDKIWLQTDKLQRCRWLPLEQAINWDKSWKTKARVFCFGNDLTGDM